MIENKISEFSRDEASLMLFLETQVVDYFGKVKSASMNDIDFDIAKRWNDEGLIKFGRRPAKEIMKTGSDRFYLVQFTNEAWELAHRFRRERAERHIKTIKRKLKCET